jgi:predicted nucleotidyltransferase
MKTAAIIAEYNPFHNGHEYMIGKIRELTGADVVIVLMSGDFVQRGAPAVCDKNLRTKMALMCGADIVFELPSIYALGSAEMFANGAVNLICSLQNVDYLCFGSECGDIEALKSHAKLMEEYIGTPGFKEELSEKIKNGMSYPAAFNKITGKLSPEGAKLLESPNNLLGIEYIRALLRANKSGKYSLVPEPVTVKRTGDEHFETDISAMPSATAVRKALKAGFSDIVHSVPTPVYRLISENYNRLLPIDEDDFNDMLFIKLNSMSDEELSAIPGINPDLLRKIMSFKGQQVNISDLILKAKSKCFTYTSISRALFRILLEPYYSDAYKRIKADSGSVNTNKTDVCNENTNGDTEPKIPYLRLLGFKKDASAYLRNLRYSETCNIITKPADGNLSDPLYKLDIHAANIYSQIVANKYRTGFTSELKTGPVMV